MSNQGVAQRLRAFMSGSFSRTVAVIAVAAAVAGPLLLLAFGGNEASQLPWYTWLIVLLLGLIVAGTGYYMFKHNSREASDISISPKPR